MGLVVAWSCRGISGLRNEKTAEVKVTTGDVEKGAGRVAAYGPPGKVQREVASADGDSREKEEQCHSPGEY